MSQTLAERKLAALLLVETDIVIEPYMLGAFIRRNWDRIAPLAHIIHGREERMPDTSKPNPGMTNMTKGQTV